MGALRPCNDPYELYNLDGEPGQGVLIASLKAELVRLKREGRDEHQLADRQLPNGVGACGVIPIAQALAN